MMDVKDMIDKYCSNGVEFKTLGELGVFENIGVDKKTIQGQQEIRLLNYMDVYKHVYIDSATPKMLVTASASKIKNCTVEKGDIFITPTSETRDDIGHASVVLETIPNTCYSYHIMRYRLNEYDMTTSFFIRYLFESNCIREQIHKYSKGLTRFGLSKNDFAKITIPFPHIEVRREIVNILDKFTELEATLKAELEARRKQYEYYRNKLLTFNEFTPPLKSEVKWLAMNEIGTFIRGNGLQKKDFVEQGVGCIHYGQVYTHYGTFADKTITFITPELARKLKKAQKGDLIIATTSENIEDVCKAVAWLGVEDIAISGDAYIFRHNHNPKYLAYIFQTEMFLQYKRRVVTGTKVMRVSGENMGRFVIPIPPIEVQNRIVAILDKFETLVNDISQGLPAEIAARRRQYEYYREKLLTFKRKEDGEIQPCS